MQKESEGKKKEIEKSEQAKFRANRFKERNIEQTKA